MNYIIIVVETYGKKDKDKKNSKLVSNFHTLVEAQMYKVMTFRSWYRTSKMLEIC